MHTWLDNSSWTSICCEYIPESCSRKWVSLKSAIVQEIFELRWNRFSLISVCIIIHFSDLIFDQCYSSVFRPSLLDAYFSNYSIFSVHSLSFILQFIAHCPSLILCHFVLSYLLLSVLVSVLIIFLSLIVHLLLRHSFSAMSVFSYLCLSSFSHYSSFFRSFSVPQFCFVILLSHLFFSVISLVYKSWDQCLSFSVLISYLIRHSSVSHFLPKLYLSVSFSQLYLFSKYLLSCISSVSQSY
jgi:hypothetical protein